MTDDLMTTLRDTHGGVVVPTGFDGDDARAFAHGLRLAQAMGTSMSHLHRGNMMALSSDLGVRSVLERWGELPPGSRPEDVAVLGFWVRKLGVQKGDVRHAVIEFVKSHALDLLVIGTTRSALRRLVSGTGPTVKDVEAPTLFLPPDSRDLVDRSTGKTRLRTVVVPVAAAPSAESAVNLSLSLARHLKAPEGRIVLLHVGLDSDRPQVTETEQAGWTYEWRGATGNAAAAICATARDVDADVIAMTTTGPRGLLDALRGSTVERVVADAPCPVLAVPAQ
jgi:nucleotide-binding universal stress UspA family protein